MDRGARVAGERGEALSWLCGARTKTSRSPVVGRNDARRVDGAQRLAQSKDEAKFPALRQQGFQLHPEARFADANLVLERARRLQPGDYFANLLLGIKLLRTAFRRQ